MIQFINNINILRDELYNNSKDILKLLEKRKELAAKIGECKNVNGSKIRNREREIEILKSLSDDKFMELVLNLLFELSINYEITGSHTPSSIKYSITINETRYAEYKSHKDNLIFLLSRMLNPGTVILCKQKGICEVLTMAGHHITNIMENPDFILYLDGRTNQDIIIKECSMLVSENFFANKENIYNLEIR